jgi:oxygen-independent coproporphyrinogen-3 oxidase
VERYLEALEIEIGLYCNRDYIVESIYFGGGSPSLLNEQQLFRILEKVKESFHMHNGPEITLEMNPEDVTNKRLEFIEKLGINRLSIGAQSFNPGDLSYLQRNHSVEQNFLAIKKALQAGFTNLNVDYIIGLPSQSRKVLENNFEILHTFNIPHVSVYILEGVKTINSEGKDIRDSFLYYFSKKCLDQLKYEHYEVSNYCKRGYQSRHNLKYWENMSYLGVGISASGYLDGLEYSNTANLRNYFKMVKAFQLPRKKSHIPNANKRRIVMGLRLLNGISLSHFREFPNQLKFCVENQLLISKNNKISIHPEKILLLNEVLVDFI